MDFHWSVFLNFHWSGTFLTGVPPQWLISHQSPSESHSGRNTYGGVFGIPVTSQHVSKYWQWEKFMNEFLVEKWVRMYIFSLVPPFIFLFLYLDHFDSWSQVGLDDAGHILWMWILRQLEFISDEKMKMCSNFHTKWPTQLKMRLANYCTL